MSRNLSSPRPQNGQDNIDLERLHHEDRDSDSGEDIPPERDNARSYDDDDEEENRLGDDEEALLGGNSGSRGPRVEQGPTSRWPQVKSIVIEVSVMRHFSVLAGS